MKKKRQYYTLQDVKDIAMSKGGICLSKKYVNKRTPMEFECQHGHLFYKRLETLQKGSWCNDCRTKYFNQGKTRYIFEKITGYKFPSTRKILRGYELDGYNDELKLAFEYQGPQHYKEDKVFFHQKDNSFAVQKKSDEEKRQMCRNMGIKLIEVPYTVNHKKTDKDLYEFIYSYLTEIDGLDLNYRDQMQSNFMLDFYVNSPLTEYRRIAKQKGGICISDEFHGTEEKLLFKCEKGHDFKSRASDIKRGTWCPLCAREKVASNQRESLENIKNIAKEKKGECLSNEYINNNTKLEFRCVNNHYFSLKPNDLKDGHWCKKCSDKNKGKNRRYGIDYVSSLANYRGGKCLDTEYKNTKVKMQFTCSNGHQFERTTEEVILGKWCPHCNLKQDIGDLLEEIKLIRQAKALYMLPLQFDTSIRWECKKGHNFSLTLNEVKSGKWCEECKKKPITEKDLQVKAKEKEGMLISKFSEYKNQDTKLRWKCKFGHTWLADWKHIRNGTWCPRCADKDSRGKYKSLTIEKIKSIVEGKNGKVFTSKIDGGNDIVSIMCEYKHKWETKASNISKGNWCPTCAEHKRISVLTGDKKRRK